MITRLPHTAARFAADEHPRRRRFHLLAGAIVVVAVYACLVAFVRITLMH